MLYLGIKTFHIVAMVSWMAMLFYLPRLFVYHAQHKDKPEFIDIVRLQELRLYKYIGNPAMIATFLSGIAMIWLNPALFSVADSGAWLHIKLSFVMLLFIYHIACGYFIKAFAKDNCQKSHKFFRVFNEMPTILLIIIAIFAVCKPI